MKTLLLAAIAALSFLSPASADQACPPVRPAPPGIAACPPDTTRDALCLSIHLAQWELRWDLTVEPSLLAICGLQSQLVYLNELLDINEDALLIAQIALPILEGKCALMIPGACADRDQAVLDIAHYKSQIASIGLLITTAEASIVTKSAEAVTKANVSNSAYKLAAAGCCKANEIMPRATTVSYSPDDAYGNCGGHFDYVERSDPRCVGQVVNRACVDAAKLVHWESYSALVTPKVDKRCVHQRNFDFQQTILDRMNRMCAQGSAMDCADAVVWQAKQNALQAKIDGLTLEIQAANATVDTAYDTAIGLCCDPIPLASDIDWVLDNSDSFTDSELEQLLSHPDGLSFTAATAPAGICMDTDLYPDPPEFTCSGILNSGCVAAAELTHYNSWMTNVSDLAIAACLIEREIGLAQIEKDSYALACMQGGPGTPCANLVRWGAYIAVLESDLADVESDIAGHMSVINTIYLLAMNGCCTNN